MFSKSKSQFPILIVLFLIYALYTFLFCIASKDWLIENILVLGFLVYLLLQYLGSGFKFNNISLYCVFAFLVLHESGAQYIYTEHPLGEWMRTNLYLNRNGYDRLVHFSFGFLLYHPIRHILHYKYKKQLATIPLRATEIILCFASIFELIEFAVAYFIFPDTLGKTYVGTQGDIWDAQKDIFLAVIGVLLAINIEYIVRYFAPIHNSKSKTIDNYN